MASVLLAVSARLGVAHHFVSIAEELVARGDAVSVVSGEPARRWFAHLDTEFHPAPESPVTSLDGVPSLVERAKQVHARVSRVIEPMAEQWQVVQRVLESAAVEVVVADALFLGASAMAYVPRARRPAVIVVGAVPSWAPDPMVPPYGMGAVPGDTGATVVRAALYETIAAPAYVALSRKLSKHIERTFGVRTHAYIRTIPAAGDAWVQLTVPAFEFPRVAAPPNFRFVGPLRPPPSRPLPDWWDPSTEPPVIAIRADGRTAVTDLVLPTVEAFGGGEDTIVVAGVSREDAQAEARLPLPDNVHFEDRMPWPRLIPQRTVVVTDGDYLHTQHALRFGIPVVVAGSLLTDIETGARVRWARAGIDLRRKRPDSADIRGAVERIRADTSYAAAAARIAVQIERTDAEGAIADLVTRSARRKRV